VAGGRRQRANRKLPLPKDFQKKVVKEGNTLKIKRKFFYHEYIKEISKISLHQ
jgi:hypothetical protein